MPRPLIGSGSSVWWGPRLARPRLGAAGAPLAPALSPGAAGAPDRKKLRRIPIVASALCPLYLSPRHPESELLIRHTHPASALRGEKKNADPFSAAIRPLRGRAGAATPTGADRHWTALSVCPTPSLPHRALHRGTKIHRSGCAVKGDTARRAGRGGASARRCPGRWAGTRGRSLLSHSRFFI